MRVLVCGSRHWDDEDPIYAMLMGLMIESRPDPLTVIEGGAFGADLTAARWCTEHPEAEHLQFRAKWDIQGKAAGVIRNQQMLVEGKPDLVLAFHDDLSKSKGTADMVRRAQKAGIPVYILSRL